MDLQTATTLVLARFRHGPAATIAQACARCRPAMELAAADQLAALQVVVCLAGHDPTPGTDAAAAAVGASRSSPRGRGAREALRVAVAGWGPAALARGCSRAGLDAAEAALERAFARWDAASGPCPYATHGGRGGALRRRPR